MTNERTEALLYKALGYISQIESGFGLYDCLHNCVGMTNAEIEDAGYELEEHYQKDSPASLAEASDKRYISLEELERQSRIAVEYIIANGTEQTKSGNWITTFNELEKQSGLCVLNKPFFQQLIGTMLCERPEVADLHIRQDGFDAVYYLDFCPNCQQEEPTVTVQPEAGQQMLRDLIQTPMEDIHLLHAEVEIEPATIVELSADTLTDAGKDAWADVLDAKVCRIYQGAYGLQAEVDGVKPSRLQSFSTMLAGYCSEENYEKWVAQPEKSLAPSPEMKL